MYIWDRLCFSSSIAGDTILGICCGRNLGGVLLAFVDCMRVRVSFDEAIDDCDNYVGTSLIISFGVCCWDVV